MATTYRVEVRVTFVETKEVNSHGNRVKIPIIHRTLYMEMAGGPGEIGQWRVVAQRRGGQMRFTTHYWPPLEREAWWEEYRQLRIGWKREKEPNGKPSVYDQDGILRWLKFQVQNPAGVLEELLTKPPGEGA